MALGPASRCPCGTLSSPTAGRRGGPGGWGVGTRFRKRGDRCCPGPQTPARPANPHAKARVWRALNRADPGAVQPIARQQEGSLGFLGPPGRRVAPQSLKLIHPSPVPGGAKAPSMARAVKSSP